MALQQLMLMFFGVLLASVPVTCSKLAIEPQPLQFKLQELPYDYAATEPFIDELTNIVHHNRTLRGVVNNLNLLLSSCAGLEEVKDLESILVLPGTSKIQPNCSTPVRNNAGSLFNHQLYFRIIGPPPNVTFEASASLELQEAIEESFGDFSNFTGRMTTAALSVFGSGWAWLCVEEDSSLNITTTPNQDNPMMTSIVANPCTPILGIDVWEHAYFLSYLNVRADYVDAFWNVVNWEAVSQMYVEAVEEQTGPVLG